MPTTVDRAEMIARLCRLAAEQAAVDASEVTLDTHLYNDLNYDSLDAVEYAMTIEEEFDVDITDAQAEEVKTVRDALRVLESLVV